MKLLGGILWLLLLLGAYALGAGFPARTEPAVASTTSFEAALDHTNPLLRSFGISRSLRAMDAEGVDDVVAAVEAAGFWFDRQEYRLFMAAWVPIDPDEAVIWAFSRPGMLQDRASEAVLEALGYFNPSRALHVLQSIEDRDRADSLHILMAQGWARSDFRDGLAEHLVGQPASLYRQRATAALTNEILKDGPEALIAWVDTIEADPGNAFKRTAFQRAVNALAEIDPVRAARWVDEHLGRPYAKRAPNTVARRWAEEDPAAAMSWLVSLPPGDRGRRNREAHLHRMVETRGRSRRGLDRRGGAVGGSRPADSRARPSRFRAPSGPGHGVGPPSSRSRRSHARSDVRRALLVSIGSRGLPGVAAR